MPGGGGDRGHLWVRFTGSFAREGWDQGPRTPPRLSLLRVPRRVPPGLSRHSQPQTLGVLKDKTNSYFLGSRLATSAPCGMLCQDPALAVS